MDWKALRDEFPVTRHWAFFDHAAVAPLPAAAARTLAECGEDFAENGVLAVPAWGARIERTRQLAGQMLDADPQDIAFVASTTAGIGLVAEGFPWRARRQRRLARGRIPVRPKLPLVELGQPGC